jgi:predicted transcriptional regulator
MHNPARDPFFEGLWADVQEGIDAANAGDLFDLEDVARDLRAESTTAAES